MATYNLSETGLKSEMTPSVDPAIQQQIIDYLVGKTAYTDPDTGTTIQVQSGAGISTPDPAANVLVEINASNTVTTDQNLKAIIEDTPQNVSLVLNSNVSGADPSAVDYPVLIATGNGNNNIYLNTSGGDTVLTGSGSDVVLIGVGPGGITGGDSINSGAGNDIISDNSTGGSTLSGGAGNDALYYYNMTGGGGFGDTLLGGDGNDTLSAGGSNGSVLHGGNNDDVLISNDWVYGAANTLFGDDGNDALYGGYAEDSLYGGNGNDTLTAGAGYNQLLDGGAGDDLILGSGQPLPGIQISSIDTMQGGEGNDTIYTLSDNTEGRNALAYGDAGNDTIIAGTGFDSLSGGDGNDLLVGGSHTVTISGDAGDDVLYSQSAWTSFGAGTALSGGDGNDSLYAGSGSDSLNGDAGNDLLVGGANTLFEDGGTGDDVIYTNDFPSLGTGAAAYGGAGNDSIYAGYGYDTLYGGDGNDLEVGGRNTVALHGGNDDDVLYSQSIAASGIQAGTATTLYGDAGNDTLYGGAGDDTLYGGAGNDVLVAGSGTQTLIGGDDGSEFIGSSTGTASMVGGAAQDVFFLNNQTSFDTIDGGGGPDNVVNFLDHTSGDVTSITGGPSGSLLVHFGENPGDQVTQISNIQWLEFSDGVHQKL
ncbi:calcium-binding protein [Bradyrhizobium guangzhouense]|uniref:calcium-binding protein n=1 Tax=Bradyrhizobium guangzhouense TaxID=1325095 RepID=UPI0024C03791|nr:calcium-binding protein [Bradyrhizobium guangzhouense]